MLKYPDIHVQIITIGDETLDRCARRLKRVVQCRADYNLDDTELEDFSHILIGTSCPVEGLPYIIDDVIDRTTGDTPLLDLCLSRSMLV